MFYNFFVQYISLWYIIDIYDEKQTRGLYIEELKIRLPLNTVSKESQCARFRRVFTCPPIV